MAAGTRCSACGGELADGSQFCGLCGARQPSSCARCATALVEGAVFCGSCGAPVSAAAPAAVTPVAPPAPSACSQCGEPLREGARFCRKCGAAAVPGAVAPAGARQQAAQVTAQPQPGSAQAIIDQLTWSSAAAGLGFIIALLSVFFPWVKASAGGLSVEAAPLDDTAIFRIGDILGSDTSSIDGLATLLVAGAGLVALVVSMLGRVNAATARSLIVALGAALVEGAVFCGSCGAPVSAAAPAAVTPVAPPAPSACSQCGEPLREGARFCRKCGAAAVPGAVAPAGARQQAAQATAQP